ncbi:hypothetical protein MHY22_08110, partial [Corynebacterium sp. ACRPO]|nr:hypothetical protein [Corynebacterium sp. ACRPO]
WKEPEFPAGNKPSTKWPWPTPTASTNTYKPNPTHKQLDTLYPIGQIDFTTPDKITWPTLEKHEVYLHTLEELLEYSQQAKNSDDFWLNADFIENLKTRGNLAE